MRIAVCALGAGLLAGQALADTLNVPAEFATIQAAIDAASGGDTVLVADGLYAGTGNVNLDTAGKAITVKSLNGPGACTIDGHATNRGFLIQSGEGPSTRIEGFTVKNGAAPAGAGVYISASSPTIVSCVFTGGVAVTGGGVYSAGGGPTLTDCRVVGNINRVDYASGGGVYILGGSATLTGCEISGNELAKDYKEPGQGGGLFIMNAAVTLSGCTLDNNHADMSNGMGGAVYVKGGTVSLNDCTISNNSAGKFSDSAGYGGGLFIEPDSSAAVTDCAFNTNHASGGVGDSALGGAVFSQGAGQFTGCSFEANTADSAGAVFAEAPLTFSDCTFAANKGYGFAGAVYSAGGIFTDCLFDSNAQPNYGGGAMGCTGTTIDRCVFVNNSTYGEDKYGGGGAINSNGDNIITNCVFAGNEDRYKGNGGAITAWQGDRIVNCVFFDNVTAAGTGSAIWGQKAGAKVANCIFWHNVAPACISGAVEVSYSNVELGFAGAGNIDADPMFADPAGLDFHLKAGSPSIDAGSNSAVPPGIETDLDGLPRFQNDAATPDTGEGSPPIVDMGAYEVAGGETCYPDFTGDGALDLFDFLAFVNSFNAGEDRADCADDALFDLFDFLCFVNAFNAGC